MIDSETLFERCGGHRELVSELLDDFLRRCDEEVARVSDDGADLQRTAHRIKGVALNLAFPELEKVARSVEISPNRADGRKELVSVLRETCQEARVLRDSLDND